MFRLLAQTAIHLVAIQGGFQSPVHLSAPAGDPRLFVVEQRGVIKIIANGQTRPRAFLDIRSKVRSGGEQGLFSIAFHPDYARNGFFFVDYTDLNGDTKVERYHVSSDVDVADPSSAKLILGVAQPYSNHNGGQIAFGLDGRLYVGMGDGGAGGDPHGNGQNRAALLAKLLRIDVDHNDYRSEVWALGLRNPWRFSFDRVTGLLYIADVGQNLWEEIDVAPAGQKGLNYGWNIREGSHCYASVSCRSEGLTDPVLDYSHAEGCSVTGGFVYRGRRLPQLAGQYFYADYCRGWVRSFKYVDGRVTERKKWDFGDVGNILSFGEDSAGDIYVLSDNGNVYRIEN